MRHPLPDELSALHDGELSQARAGELTAHLAGCAACRAAYGGYGRLTSRLAALPRARADRRAWASLRARLAASGEVDPARPGRTVIHHRLWRLRRGLMVAAAAAVVLAVGLIWLGTRGDEAETAEITNGQQIETAGVVADPTDKAVRESRVPMARAEAGQVADGFEEMAELYY